MRICAGIVSYNPEIKRLEANIEAVSSQVEKVYLFDNNSDNFCEIKELVSGNDSVTLICSNKNVGIAKALNQLCEKAMENQFQWILTLDQDSVCPTNLIEKLSKHADDVAVGIICPAVHYDGWNTKKENKSEVEEIFACMTSASLTNLFAWKKVFGFNEDYFIDFVDNEFCMKLRLSNFTILRDNTVFFHHQLGDSGVKKILGLFPLNYSRHTPRRLYYMIRNNLLFINKYKQHLSILKEYIKIVYIIFINLYVANEKKKTLQYISLGIKDYHHNKLGECTKNY